MFLTLPSPKDEIQDSQDLVWCRGQCRGSHKSDPSVGLQEHCYLTSQEDQGGSVCPTRRGCLHRPCHGEGFQETKPSDHQLCIVCTLSILEERTLGCLQNHCKDHH